eukprot:g5305.t1
MARTTHIDEVGTFSVGNVSSFPPALGGPAKDFRVANYANPAHLKRTPETQSETANTKGLLRMVQRRGAPHTLARQEFQHTPAEADGAKLYLDHYGNSAGSSGPQQATAPPVGHSVGIPKRSNWTAAAGTSCEKFPNFEACRMWLPSEANKLGATAKLHAQGLRLASNFPRMWVGVVASRFELPQSKKKGGQAPYWAE